MGTYGAEPAIYQPPPVRGNDAEKSIVFFEGILILRDGQHLVFRPRETYIGICDPAICVEQGYGIERATTTDIKCCAGVVMEEEDCHLLIHARYAQNLEVLLDAMLPVWRKYTAGNAPLHLVTRPPHPPQTNDPFDEYNMALAKYSPDFRICPHRIESADDLTIERGKKYCSKQKTL